MKVELIFGDDGNLMIIKDGEIEYHWCEYSIPDAINKIISQIPKYKSNNVDGE